MRSQLAESLFLSVPFRIQIGYLFTGMRRKRKSVVDSIFLFLRFFFSLCVLVVCGSRKNTEHVTREMYHREEFEVSDIRFRSVSERRLADVILSKEGKWDNSQQSFLTREKQLQERTKVFQTLHSTLRYLPAVAYEAQGKDVDYVYPNCPKELLRKHQVKNSQLTMEDPTPDNIEYRHEIAEKNKLLREKSDSSTVSAIFGAKEKEEFVGAMEHQLMTAAQLLLGRQSSRTSVSIRGGFGGGEQPGGGGRAMSTTTPHHQHSTDTSNSSAMMGSHYHLSSSPTPLPRIRDETRSHSSLLRQLKMTKQQAVAHQQENSTVKCLLNMKASADLKRAITRMFADPKNAEGISNEEQQKRDAAYQDERRRTQRYQNDLLKEEREMMERELATFSKE